MTRVIRHANVEFAKTFARRKFVQIHFFRPVIDRSSSQINERERERTLLAKRDWNETIHFVPSSLSRFHDD